MKICPICEHENPSSVNFCGKCGASLTDGKLPDEIILRKDLEEAKETIALLKRMLAAAQEQAGNSNNEAEIQSLKSKLQLKTAQSENLIKQIAGLNVQLTAEKNRKKGGNWGWFFVLLFVAAGIAAAVIYAQLDTANYNLQSLKDSQKDEKKKLQNTLDSLRTALIDSLKKASNNAGTSNIIVADSAAAKKIDSTIKVSDHFESLDDYNMTAQEAVKNFFRLLSAGDYYAAWLLTDNPSWIEKGGYNYFNGKAFGTNVKLEDDRSISDSTVDVKYYMTLKKDDYGNENALYYCRQRVLLRKEYSPGTKLKKWIIVRILYINHTEPMILLK